MTRAVTWAGAGGEGPDSASWLACLQRELEAREATVKSEGGPWGEGLWCGPEKLPTLQGTGGWGAGSVAGLEKQGPRKAGDVWCGPGKAWRANLWCLEKQGPGEATRLWSLEKRRCGGEGLTTTGDMMRAGDCQQGSGGKEGGRTGGSRRQREEEQQETAAAQWQRSLIFSSQSKNCGARSGGSLLAGLNYALVDSLEFGGATHKSV